MEKTILEMNAELSKIEHFKNFPNLIPFLGENYVSKKHKKLLLIGESHYLPQASTIHLDVQQWYQSNQSQLNDEEADWIYTSNLVKYQSTKMFKTVNRTLVEAGINSELSSSLEEVAYYNYFQRPAIERESIKDIATDYDIEKAYEIFKEVVKAIQPDLIIFLSKYSIESVEKYKSWEFTNSLNITYTYTNHPMCAHWNRVVREEYFGKRTSRQHFSHFIEEQKFMNK